MITSGYKQKQKEQAEWEKGRSPKKAEAYEPSREGNRRHARGRAYDPNRYNEGESAAPVETTAPEQEAGTDSQE